MIPILYKLRDGILFKDSDAFSLVISEAPLNIIKAGKRAVRIVHLCDGNRTVQQVADAAGISEEAQVFKVCEYFNRRSILETRIARNPGYFPPISVIIPTRNRDKELEECLESVYAQDYPPDKVEVIVVDDGSLDGTRKLAGAFPCKLLANPYSRGQSYCRNLGAQESKNGILAFLDDDCVAGTTWLRDLVAYLRWEDLGAVGGYVDGYSDRSSLDRYEKSFSRLNLGRYILRGAKDTSNFYIPTCNMLVRKRVFLESGKISEGLHLGEDVDFIWRMRDAGWQALYVPSGTVKHKHRNTLRTMLRRRADYGTTEAALCLLHPYRVKTMQLSPIAAVAFAGLCAAVVLLNLLPIVVTGACFIAETVLKVIRLRKKRIGISFLKVCSSVTRMYISYFYSVSFHLSRYYLVPLLLLGFAAYSFWILALFNLVLSASVDYSVKRPSLNFPLFLFYYLLDHMSYQIGVLAGCLRARSFRPFRLRFHRRSI